MRNLLLVTLAGLILMSVQSCSSNQSNEQKMPKESNNEKQNDVQKAITQELITKWQNNKEYCIETVEAMPESEFDFAPADSLFNFSEQATHIATTMHWQMNKLGFNQLPDFQNDTKAQLIESYNALFDYFIAELKSLEPDELDETVDVFYGVSSKRRLLNLMDNHVAHHRGQMLAYLRIKNIQPPKYRGW
ncbi:MAG: DinB family protein [bacterium]|nr:DinB family protein [bacterium]